MKSTELAPAEPAALEALRPLAESTSRYAARARADATRTAYATQWRAFRGWCEVHGLPPLPAAPAVLAYYIAARADGGASPSTIAQTLAAVDLEHQRACTPSPRRSPEVDDVWSGIRRTPRSPQRQATPLRPADLRVMVQGCGDGLLCLRDRGVIVVGFAGAFRGEELARLDVEDVREAPDGLVVDIRRSKTDQEGEGASVGLPFGSDRWTCPVRAYRDWIAASGIESEAIFRNVLRGGKLGPNRLCGREIARIVQRCARRAGLMLSRISGHSLRAGLATTAAEQRKPAHVIMAQTRHKSIATVYRYIRRSGADLFDDNAASGIGL